MSPGTKRSDASDLIWVDGTPALHELLARLADASHVAIDTESNSMHAYTERVCLVQLSIPTGEDHRTTLDAIVDPLMVDIEPLGVVFEDPTRQKILHGADYDVLSLKRSYGFTFESLFDTMIAARVLGWTRYGLAALLEEHFGVRPDKRFQRHDWGKRPIPADAIDYARGDTRWLPALREIQLAELRERDRLDLCLHACERQTRVEPRARGFDPDAVWRVKGAVELDPMGRAIAREVFVLRDALARELDRPVFKVMGDATLLELARRRPRTTGALRVIPGVGRLWSGRRAHELLQTIEAASSAEPPVVPKPDESRPPREVRDRYEALRRWRKAHADAHGFEPDVVLSRQTLWALAESAPTDVGALTEVRALDDWERARYGTELLRVIAEASG
jgi:ribonuclease D